MSRAMTLMMLRDVRCSMGTLNAAAIWAGLTAFVWYAFGAVPLHMGVSNQLGLSTAQTSSWIFIVWFSGAVCSITASVYFRHHKRHRTGHYLPLSQTVSEFVTCDHREPPHQRCGNRRALGCRRRLW